MNDRRNSNVSRDSLVVVRDLNHCFGRDTRKNQVLFNVNLELMSGTMTVLTGPSGSGKTTLLTLIGCLRSVQDGSVRLIGRELFGLPRSQRTDLRRRLGFIFQTHNLLESLTAQQNVQMALQLQRIGRAAMKRRSEDILSRLGLREHLHAKPQQLSVGQQQRVAIARALASNPSVVLADEPTASLDQKTAHQVVQLLKEMTLTQRACVLIVTHDDRVLAQADQVVNLVDGRIL